VLHSMFEPGTVALAAVNDEAFSITQPRPVPHILVDLWYRCDVS